ncbi:hypothetical protein ABLE91_22420 [Aquabacter sp. CN5-332]|uniref:hypothetical protein n=1 Tax=Aquabacter sp. CN5-332 TaxID=3156608 RepID=UPI0032B31BFB
MTLVSLDPDSPPEEAAPKANAADGDVRAALARVLAAEEFVSSPRLADFLRFIVEATLSGRAEEIKGYTIAVEALGRPTSFDPQSDPIVRVEATRLRRALERYYGSAGPDETLEIVVPKGSYVPAFRARGTGVEAPAPVEPALPVLAPPPPPRRHIWPWAAAASLVLLMGGALIWLTLAGFEVGIENGPNTVTVTLGGRPTTAAELADRVGMPILEVRPFEIAGVPTPAPEEIHTLEVRLRDAFSRFDFVDVMAAGPEASQRECRGAPPRSVFSLGGLAEGHSDGTFSLLLRLSDRCGGNIIWSKELEGLKRGPDRATTEQRVVREVASSLMESYSALPTRARAQVRAEAPDSGFGCIAQAFAVLRRDESASASAARSCLDRLVMRDTGFGIAHSVKAMMLLEEALAVSDKEPEPAARAQMRHEAELGADLSPTSAFAAKVLANVDFFLGERDAALAAAERAVALNPLDYDVAASAGTIMIGLGKVEQGEALLTFARENGAQRTQLQDIYLGIAAFLRTDEIAAANAVPPLETHPTAQTRIALALVLHVLGRAEDERRVVATLMHDTQGGPAGVQRLVHRMLPWNDNAMRVLGELEAAGLARDMRAPVASKG